MMRLLAVLPVFSQSGEVEALCMPEFVVAANLDDDQEVTGCWMGRGGRVYCCTVEVSL